VAVTGVAAVVGIAAALPAGAVTPPAGYGFDDHAHLIVGGGSDTTYKAQLGLTDLWDQSSVNNGCQHLTAVGPNQNSCQQDSPFALSNYQGDTVAQANPVGSGGGIGALNGNAAGNQEGTANPIVNAKRTDSVGITNGSSLVNDNTITAGDVGKSVSSATAGIPLASYVSNVDTVAHTFHLSSAPNTELDINATATATINADIQPYDCVGAEAGAMPDFARSSRAANSPTGGSAPCGDELRADTFWGYAQDGVAVTGFNGHGNLLNGLAAPHLSGQELFNIWNCSGGTGSAFGGRTDTDQGSGNKTVLVTNGSGTVTDYNIALGDTGHGVSGSGIPANTFVANVVVSVKDSGGNITTPGSFQLSSTQTGFTPVNAGPPGGNTVTIAAANRVRWSDIIPSIGPGTSQDADIVPWQMNTASGTFATFQTYIKNNTTNFPSGWSPDGQCARKLSRVDAATVTSGSPSVTDLAIVAGDDGHVLQPTTGIPAGSFVKNINTVAHTFDISSSATSDVPVNATLSATSVNIESSGSLPLENDIKPLIQDPISLVTTNPSPSPENPENWMWWGSFGVFSSFPFTSSEARQSVQWTVHFAAIKGFKVGSGNILQFTYPIARLLFHVTRKADADCVKSQDSVTHKLGCAFAAHPGPDLGGGVNDLNVTGGVATPTAFAPQGTPGGISGAIREYTRFLCRIDGTQQGIDPYTGVNFDTEITGAINNAGFTTVKGLNQTDGSRCQIFS
jgi:hypothetical protein